MIFTPTPLTGSYVIGLEPFTDERGWFARFYCEKEFERLGHTGNWVQMNHSTTYAKGSLRGMHYQLPPYREIKMVRCIAGAVYDVIIDIREGSATFLQWFGTELSAANKNMLYIPEGFAHGFQCLTDNCELIYHHTEFYTPNAEGGIRFDDPMVNIQWPLPAGVLSARDGAHPYLTDDFKGI
ncbi:dTDP-4-dehydrorhamnose 3,5-epimerase [Niastella populi]|uniref:dTDP-4-dehydrorhamnose 3,5-epimerase n=1 Tax=Niastella populi TaxID=550983 RepID=A0A1V9FI69_9BACT|nr:dTDP-4-dehydrorhamnose 3,5-epimerase [Niastella populi]OQP57971.1 dTDP-4-dehydrorhamnose 3,5-epimerase [Niastella populi]